MMFKIACIIFCTLGWLIEAPAVPGLDTISNLKCIPKFKDIPEFKDIAQFIIIPKFKVVSWWTCFASTCHHNRWRIG